MPPNYTPQQVARFWRKVNRTPDCWLWTASVDRNGRGQVNINGKMERAHRVAYMIASGDIPQGMCVMHSCDNPLCVNPSHLSLGTHSDNMKDMASKGRHNMQNPINRLYGKKNPQNRYPERRPRGEKHGRAQLTQAQVAALRQLYAQGGVSHRELARRFGISASQTFRILHNQSWRIE